MKCVSLVLLIIVVMLSAVPTFADGVNLSARISGTPPWPAYGGNCPPMFQELPREALPEQTNACVSFSGRYVSGYLLKGEVVYYEIESRCESGEWHKITRVYRCGNPASGRYWVAYVKPTIITQTQNILVDRPVYVDRPVEVVRVVEKPVEVVRTERIYIDRPVSRYSPQATPAGQRLADTRGLSVPGVSEVRNRAIGSVGFSWSQGDYSSTGTCVEPPDDGTCGPPPDDGVPSPTPGEGGDTGNPGSTPPGGSEVGGPTVGPPPPPPHGNGGAVLPPAGGSPVTPAGPNGQPTGYGTIVPSPDPDDL